MLNPGMPWVSKGWQDLSSQRGPAGLPLACPLEIVGSLTTAGLSRTVDAWLEAALPRCFSFFQWVGGPTLSPFKWLPLVQLLFYSGFIKVVLHSNFGL